MKEVSTDLTDLIADADAKVPFQALHLPAALLVEAQSGSAQGTRGCEPTRNMYRAASASQVPRAQVGMGLGEIAVFAKVLGRKRFDHSAQSSGLAHAASPKPQSSMIPRT